MIHRGMTVGLALALFISVIGLLRADVKMPAIFGNHMVLQQEAALPVWGWADPGEKVTVTGSYDESSETIHITKIEATK